MRPIYGHGRVSYLLSHPTILSDQTSQEPRSQPLAFSVRDLLVGGTVTVRAGAHPLDRARRLFCHRLVVPLGCLGRHTRQPDAETPRQRADCHRFTKFYHDDVSRLAQALYAVLQGFSCTLVCLRSLCARSVGCLVGAWTRLPWAGRAVFDRAPTPSRSSEGRLPCVQRPVALRALRSR